jgi:hypothetical protein
VVDGGQVVQQDAGPFPVQAAGARDLVEVDALAAMRPLSIRERAEDPLGATV